MVDRTILAAQIFECYDADDSGHLSAAEFTTLLQAFDPRVKADGVLKTIQKIAPGQEGLDVPGFNKWVTMVFGKASDEDFESGMRMLLSTAEATSPRKKRAATALSAVDDEWETICVKSSGGSGTPLVDSTWAELLAATMSTASVL